MITLQSNLFHPRNRSKAKSREEQVIATFFEENLTKQYARLKLRILSEIT
jgi:hypothetical protein